MTDNENPTTVNGIVLDRLSTDDLISFAADLFEEGAELHRDRIFEDAEGRAEVDSELAVIRSKLDIVEAAINAR